MPYVMRSVIGSPRQREHRVRGCGVGHELAGVRLRIALLVERRREPEAARVLVRRQPGEAAANRWILARHARRLQHERRETGGIAVAVRLERGAIDALPAGKRRDAPAAIVLLRPA